MDARPSQQPAIDTPGGFLRAVTLPDAWMAVVAIHPETGRCIGRGFQADSIAAAEAFVEAHADCNLYWTVNPLAERLDKKPAKKDVSRMAWVHVDIDDPSDGVLTLLRDCRLRPTLTLFSGGGYQAFWRLREPLRIDGNLTVLEGANKHMIRTLKAAKVDEGAWNIDRIMRLPGTMNWPTRTKLKRGRVPTAARLIEFHPERVYAFSEFAAVTTDDGEPAQDRSADLLRKVAAMLRDGASDDAIHEKLGGHPHAADQSDPRRAVQRCIDKARTKTPAHTIDVTAGELASVVAQAEAALLAADAGIYQRGGQLVRIATLERDTAQHSVSRVAGSVVILPVTRDWLPLPLGRAALWRRFDKRERKWLRIDPPASVAAAMIAAAGEWKFPSLAGIVTAPTLRGDASLLDRPGYDPASHLFAAFDPGDFPAIRAKPSVDDALAAVELLQELFSEAVFSGGSQSPYASVQIAACITACLRHALPAAPAFALSAHKQGSGKTTAAKVAAQLAMGRDPPVLAPTDDEAEFKKALLAVLIGGDAAVLIDNVAKPVDSAALCAVLTSAVYSDRVLGSSQKVSVPTATTWLLTGNSIEFVGDLTTRVLLSVLDPECEHPEARPFRRNLGNYVLEHRGELVRAALSIPLAYVAAGSPKVDAPRSRFERWDALVRLPLLWLGLADPLATQADLRASDPVREALVGLLHAWHSAFSSQPATVAEAISKANGAGQSGDPLLLDALQAVAGERDGKLNARKLGRYIGRVERRIEDGRRFERTGNDPLTKRWSYRVVGVTGVTGVSANPSREDGRDDS